MGAEGERRVGEVLATMQRYGWTALHEVHWGGGAQGNMEHMAMGGGGMVIMDAKNWWGTVTVSDGALRGNGYERGRETEGVA